MSRVYDEWLEDADPEDIINYNLDSYDDYIERMIAECDKHINPYGDRLYSQKRVNIMKNTNIFPIYTNVRGVTFNNRQNTVSKLIPNQNLTLIREPENKYDKNAIAVYSEYGQVGYIAKEINEDLAASIDNGENYKCIVIKVTGSSRTNYGVVIRVEKKQEEIERRNNEKTISVNKYNIGDTLYHVEYGKIIIEKVIGEYIYTKTGEDKIKSFLIGDYLNKQLLSKEEYDEVQEKTKNISYVNKTDNYNDIENKINIREEKAGSNVLKSSKSSNAILLIILLISIFFIMFETIKHNNSINYNNNLIVQTAQQEPQIEKETEVLDIYGKLAERMKHGNYEYISIIEKGYINLLKNIDENEGLVGIVSAQGLNFRESNTIDSDVILVLHENEKVFIFGESNDWYFGLYECEDKTQSEYGWCSKYYIKLNSYNINTGELLE
jgi:hypothetical protein